MVGRESKFKPKVNIYVGSSVVLSVPLWGGILIIEKLGICGLIYRVYGKSLYFW